MVKKECYFWLFKKVSKLASLLSVILMTFARLIFFLQTCTYSAVLSYKTIFVVVVNERYELTCNSNKSKQVGECVTWWVSDSFQYLLQFFVYSLIVYHCSSRHPDLDSICKCHRDYSYLHDMYIDGRLSFTRLAVH